MYVCSCKCAYNCMCIMWRLSHRQRKHIPFHVVRRSYNIVSYIDATPISTDRPLTLRCPEYAIYTKSHACVSLVNCSIYHRIVAPTTQPDICQDLTGDEECQTERQEDAVPKSATVCVTDDRPPFYLHHTDTNLGSPRQSTTIRLLYVSYNCMLLIMWDVE